MFQAQQVKLERFDNGAWWLTTQSKQEYRVDSINQHCTEKLEQILKNGKGTAYITLEQITEYHSEASRCKISLTADPGWNDDDVYCLVTNETGNRNPNAKQDIAAATERMRQMGINL